MGLFIPTIFKLLTPKIVNSIMDYVFKENELDLKVKKIQKKIKKLERLSHPRREFVACNKCKQQIKEK